MEEKMFEEVGTETDTEAEEVHATVETLEATPVIPMKTKVANFVYKHRTAIVGIVAGVAGMVGGLIVGGKTGFAAGVNSVKTDAPDQIPMDEAEIPTDIPENIEL